MCGGLLVPSSLGQLFTRSSSKSPRKKNNLGAAQSNIEAVLIEAAFLFLIEKCKPQSFEKRQGQCREKKS